MLGVLVDELSVPLDSLTSGPMCDNVSTSLPSTRAEDVQRVSSPSRSPPSDLDGEVYTFGRFMPNQSSLSISTLHALEFCSSPPSSPSDKGSPRMQGFDGRDEFGRKSFSRCLSKLGGQGLMPVSEDLAYGDLPLEMVGSEVVGDANVSLSSPPGISIPMASAYANSCGGAMVGSPVLTDAISALQKYLPSNNEDEELWPPQTDSWPPSGDVYSCDEFRMYEFKVRRCMRGRSHDWTECPFAHPGEKARRRDPRRFHYSGAACPDFRKGTCQRGDACEFAHGVFECWLHPARYRTQPCKDGRNCKRRVCFFAHTNEQLRVLPGVTAQTGSPSPRASLHSPSLKASLGASYDGSPLRQALAGLFDGAMTLESLSCLGQHGFFDLPFEGHVGSPRSGYLSFAGKCAHGGFCGNLSQISSPTSTLAGHTLSPPPLSPPLSPSESPPMSPNIPSSWSSALARSMSCHSSSQVSLSQPISAASLQASISPAALSHVHTSIEASTQNSGSLSTAITLGPSPSLATTPGHRSQFERLHARPTVTTILTPEGRQAPNGQSCQVMTGLIATFQQLEPRARFTTEPSHFCTRWAPSTGLLHSALGVHSASTKTRWSGQVDPWDISEGEVDPPLERVESGRDLRAKIYGRLCKENPLENEGPDIDWVNEIVK